MNGFAIVRLGFIVCLQSLMMSIVEFPAVMKFLGQQEEKLSSVFYSIKQRQHWIHLRECSDYSEDILSSLSVGLQDNFQPSLGNIPRIMATSRRDPLF